jgi:uncharacterized protein
MRSKVFWLFVTIATSVLSQSAQAQQESLRLGAGVEGGVYFEYSSALADSFRKAESSGLSIQIVSNEGSVDNLYQLRGGEVDMAIVQNDIAYYVYEGSHGYQIFQDFSSGIPLFEEYVQVLVRSDSSIRSPTNNRRRNAGSQESVAIR